MWVKCEDESWVNTHLVERFAIEQVILQQADGLAIHKDDYKIMAYRSRGPVVRYGTYSSKGEAERVLFYLVQMLTRELHGEKVGDSDLA